MSLPELKEIIPLWEHQRKAAARAALRKDGFAFFKEIGTGKTATAITTLRYKCYEKKRLLRTLIICPPVVRTNWKREIAKYSTIKTESVLVLDGAGKDRLSTFDKEAFGFNYDGSRVPLPKIFITNYESLAMEKLFKLMKIWKPEVLILDESQRVKDFKSKRTKLAIELSDLCEFKMILSGTPILNSPMDIWSQFRILDGGESFDKNFYAFRARYFYDKNASMPASQKKFSDWQPLPGITEEFNRKIYQKAVRVLKKDCLDLPPIVRVRVESDLGAEQRRMYKSMMQDYVAYLNDKACVAQLALTKGLRLQQMISGFWVDEDGKEHAFDDVPRLKVLRDLLEEITPEQKVIVWTNFRNSYGPISAICDELKIPFVTLYGGMTDKGRQVSIDSFQSEPSVRVMIANPAAGGVGVTLTAASAMIYFTRGFALEHDIQSEGRCHRGGSEVHSKITRLDIVAAGTIDDVILQALSRKENLAASILRLRELL